MTLQKITKIQRNVAREEECNKQNKKQPEKVQILSQQCDKQVHTY